MTINKCIHSGGMWVKSYQESDIKLCYNMFYFSGCITSFEHSPLICKIKQYWYAVIQKTITIAIQAAMHKTPPMVWRVPVTTQIHFFVGLALGILENEIFGVKSSSSFNEANFVIPKFYLNFCYTYSQHVVEQVWVLNTTPFYYKK